MLYRPFGAILFTNLSISRGHWEQYFSSEGPVGWSCLWKLHDEAMAIWGQMGAAKGLQLARSAVRLLCGHGLAKHPGTGTAKVTDCRYAASDELSIQLSILHSAMAKAACSGEGLVWCVTSVSYPVPQELLLQCPSSGVITTSPPRLTALCSTTQLESWMEG